MGRYSYSYRNVIENTGKITIQDLITWGYITKDNFLSTTGNISLSNSFVGKICGINVTLNISNHAESYIRFNYTYKGYTFNYDHEIELFKCNFGKYRYYFICRDTEKRVTALYFNRGYYSSRHYHKLVYQCSRDHRNSMLYINKANSLYSKAEWYLKNHHPRKAKEIKHKANYYSLIGHKKVLNRINSFFINTYYK